MKTRFIKCSMLFALLAISIGLRAQSGHNYRYIYNAACKCIISKDNPIGIDEISVFPYLTDPDVHEHGVGYYEKVAKTKVDTFSIATFSVNNFTCYPCMNFEPGKKYAFVFHGKDDLGPVTVCFSVNDKGEIKEVKYSAR